MTMTAEDLAKFIAYGAHALPAEDLPMLIETLRAEKRHLLNGPHDPKRRFPVAHIAKIDAVIADIEHTIAPCEETADALRGAMCRVSYDIRCSAGIDCPACM